MRLHCYYCGKPVSTEVLAETVVRAVSTCPECVREDKVPWYRLLLLLRLLSPWVTPAQGVENGADIWVCRLGNKIWKWPYAVDDDGLPAVPPEDICRAIEAAVEAARKEQS